MTEIPYFDLLLTFSGIEVSVTDYTMHMVADYCVEKPGEHLMGSGIKAEHINDDAIARCLDKLYLYHQQALD